MGSKFRILHFLSTIKITRSFKATSSRCYTSTYHEPDMLGKIVDLPPDSILNSKKEVNSHISNANDLKAKLNYKSLRNDSKIMSGYLVNVKARKRREKSGLILLEGKRLIEDAVVAGHQPKAIFFSRFSDVENINLDKSVEIYHAKYKDLQLWSNVSTCPGIIGIFQMPDTTEHKTTSRLPLSIICDSVRDPGNMGSILRTASAVGCSTLILTTGCVDLWEPKVLRSAAGAHFRLKIHANVDWENIPELLPKSGSVYLADSNVVPDDTAQGDVLKTYDLDEQGVKVPVSDDPEKRVTAFQRRHKSEESLPLVSYVEADYSNSAASVLVVGGETEGLSSSAYDFARNFGGTRVFIPLENGVESLNSGTALGVLAYEIRRQRLIAGK